MSEVKDVLSGLSTSQETSAHGVVSNLEPEWGGTGDEIPALSGLTTLEVGGLPQRYIRVTTEAQALEVSRWAQAHQQPLWVIGGGSNVLCADEVLRGVTIQLALTEVLWSDPVRGEASSSVVEVVAGAGVVWSELVIEAVERGLAGIECLSGIPGWVGAAPIQNIGAYGQELSDVCVAVRAYDRERDEVRWWSTSECEFAYRQSIFKAQRGRYLILAVRLRLRVDGAPTIRYAQLQEVLERDQVDLTSLSAVSEAVLRLRAAKSMVWRPEDPNRRSVGSFFLNPIIDRAQLEKLEERCAERALPSPPRWAVDEIEGRPSERFKLPAAWLIERAGVTRGFGEGEVGISSAHTLAIINRGGASAHEIITFASAVQHTVWRAWGVWLSPEVQLIQNADPDRSRDPLSFRPRIALVTCRELPAYEVDDHPLWEELRSLEVDLALPSWDDPDFLWESCDLVIPRTTWDYQERWGEFLDWMRRVDRVTTLLNPLSLMQWNLDKRYLRSLPIDQPPTHWIDQQALEGPDEVDIIKQSVLSYCAQVGWRRAFIKPHIAASAVGTLRFSPEDPIDQERLALHLAEWLPQRTLILQPYIEAVEDIGERSLIYFNGRYSHGVRKVPVKGDYRVQDDYGATDEPWTSPGHWRSQCERLLESLDFTPLYARCDFLTSPEGAPWLVELELIEPSLFFRHDPDSPRRFAEAILSRCPRPDQD